MKKNYLLSIVAAVLLVCVLFAACAKKEEEEPAEEVSYCQTQLYVGGNADYKITLTAGKSEQLFIADGKTTDVGDFVLLTVTPTSTDLMNADLSYTLAGENGAHSDALVKDAFGATFTSEPDLSVVGKPQSVTIKNGSAEIEIPLQDMTEGIVTPKQALYTAKEALKDKLNGDDKEREIYIRLINNAEKPESSYFWYVAFIAAPTDYYSVVIDPASGSVVSGNL